MDCANIIYDFLKEYGTLVECEGRKEYALFSPDPEKGIEKKDLLFSKTGYLPDESYLFLFPVSDRPMEPKMLFSVGDRQFKVKEAEYYCLGGNKIYQRVYVYEVRSVEE